MRIGRKIKKNIRYLLKKILPSSFFNLIIFFLIRKKFISSYNNDKLYSKNYIDKTNNINEYKISSQNYEDGIIKSLIKYKKFEILIKKCRNLLKFQSASGNLYRKCETGVIQNIATIVNKLNSQRK